MNFSHFLPQYSTGSLNLVGRLKISTDPDLQKTNDDIPIRNKAIVDGFTPISQAFSIL